MTLESKNVIHKLLSSTKCSDLLGGLAGPYGTSAPPHPVCLDSELSVQEGCAALAAHKISSAPVYDAKAGGFVGMLDYRDLATYVLEVFHKVPHSQVPVDAELEITDIVKRAVMDRQGVPVKLVSNLSHRNPLVSVQASAPLIDAVEEFVRARAHRVIVLEPTEDGGQRFIGVLSQSSISAYLASQFGKLSTNRALIGTWALGEKTLADLGLVSGDVVSVTQEDTVLEALFTMHDRGVSSVAIVSRADGSSALCGSIGMTDIKEILAHRGGWRRLFENVFRFFVELRSEQGLENGGNDRAPSFTVHPSTTLISAIEKMSATHTHRVWVVNNNGEVVGVVSLSDVMSRLL
ncbi:uncharacterized protein BJ171DRAFT_63936 [Polychytrium aggregatum]|uniref:uncharacterized protein n=1 Tax=Polychytrium aggregatum TaxID=110093 RepID=UPI0022FE55F1|nr:uncharacterized protein BJ171DRAFT_63936 [Polychytrium aggregatum]KAI9205642.1 hypothetical protein BJ171DRAFT_63936 [Polychytrium aggregatum]